MQLLPTHSMELTRFLLLLVVCLVCGGSVAAAKKGAKKEADPKECEVCVANLEKIDGMVEKAQKKNHAAIEKAINKHCTLTGAGSDWKPNPALTSPKDVKMCYMFEPIKKAISQPFSTGMPKKKVCERLRKDNPEICEVKYRKFRPCYLPCSLLFAPYSVSLPLLILVPSAQGGEGRDGIRGLQQHACEAAQDVAGPAGCAVLGLHGEVGLCEEVPGNRASRYLVRGRVVTTYTHTYTFNALFSILTLRYVPHSSWLRTPRTRRRASPSIGGRQTDSTMR